MQRALTRDPLHVGREKLVDRLAVTIADSLLESFPEPFGDLHVLGGHDAIPVSGDTSLGGERGSQHRVGLCDRRCASGDHGWVGLALIGLGAAFGLFGVLLLAYGHLRHGAVLRAIDRGQPMPLIRLSSTSTSSP